MKEIPTSHPISDAILFARSPCTVAEGPRWNQREKALYWVDITEGRIYRKHADTSVDRFESFCPEIGKVGAFAFAENERLVLFAAGCKVWNCGFGGTPVLRHTLSGHAGRRFNDVFDAGDGIYFCGVAPGETNRIGELWRYDAKTGTFSIVEEETAGMPNGMGLSPDGKTFYFVVSDEKKIYAYDFGPDAIPFNRRVLCDGFEQGVPDGMCVDPADGSLYVAVWGGSRLEHIAPDGKRLDRFAFPMEKVTSAVVVGKVVYVTTANLPKSDGAFHETSAGGVFQIHKGR